MAARLTVRRGSSESKLKRRWCARKLLRMKLYKRLSAKIRNGAISLFLAVSLLLSGCATNGVKSNAPDALTEATQEPECAGGTNAALAECLLAYKAALRSCNADKGAVRDQP